MISESVTPILASIGSFLLIVAGGGKWLMGYLDAKDKASATFGPHHFAAICLSMGRDVTASFFAERPA